MLLLLLLFVFLLIVTATAHFVYNNNNEMCFPVSFCQTVSRREGRTLNVLKNYKCLKYLHSLFFLIVFVYIVFFLIRAMVLNGIFLWPLRLMEDNLQTWCAVTVSQVPSLFIFLKKKPPISNDLYVLHFCNILSFNTSYHILFDLLKIIEKKNIRVYIQYKYIYYY